jgi:type 1 fimbriae regulatory protein FimB
LFPSYRSLLADLLGLRYIVSGVPIQQIDKKLSPGDLKFIAHTKDGFLYENPRALPRVMFVPGRMSANFDTVLDTGVWPDFYPTREVLLQSTPRAARQPAADARQAAICLLLYRHGLRVSELTGMRKSALNLDQGRIWISRRKGSLSTEHRLTGIELRAIKRYLKERTDKLPWLVVSERGTPLTERAIYRIVSAAGKRTGLITHPHQLRHSCGFYLANRGTEFRTNRKAAALPQLEGTGITEASLRTAAKRNELRTIMKLRKILTTEEWIKEWLSSCHVTKGQDCGGKTAPKKVNQANGSSETDRLNRSF